MDQKLVNRFVIGVFVLLYLLTSIISTIHVIDFFKLSNADWLAITLAVAFEVGAAASLASIIALKKMNKGIVWALFFLLTAMQAMGNTFYAFTHLHDFQSWIDLFGLTDFELIAQKRILSIVSGAVLPLVALGFIKSLVDYIKPEEIIPVVEIKPEQVDVTETPTIVEEVIAEPIVVNGTLQKYNLVNENNRVYEKLDDPIIEEPVVEETIEEPVAEEVIEPVVEEVIEPVEEPRFTDEQNNILNKISVFK